MSYSVAIPRSNAVDTAVKWCLLVYPVNACYFGYNLRLNICGGGVGGGI
jgi:hypothetical protein